MTNPVQVGTGALDISLSELFKDWKRKGGCGSGSSQACSTDVPNFLSPHNLSQKMQIFRGNAEGPVNRGEISNRGDTGKHWP